MFLFILLSALSCSKEEVIEDNKDTIIPVESGGKFVANNVVVNTITDSVLTFCQWNIGHYSKGKSSFSTIKEADFLTSVSDYHRVIDSIAADFISINEYSAIFCNDYYGNRIKARDVIFDSYSFFALGKSIRYSCNALFSRWRFSSCMRDYSCNKDVVITHTTSIKATDYYLIESNFSWMDQDVVLVSTHLAFDLNNNMVASNQIDELIETYSKSDRVIILADWNADQIFFDKPKQNGFSMANCGEFGVFETYPSRNKPLDNIVVKGFEITEVKMIESELSDHYPLMARLRIK